VGRIFAARVDWRRREECNGQARQRHARLSQYQTSPELAHQSAYNQGWRKETTPFQRRTTYFSLIIDNTSFPACCKQKKKKSVLASFSARTFFWTRDLNDVQ
jgi:hypothetical protein